MPEIPRTVTLNYKRVIRASQMAHSCYRFYLYWRSEERMYRRCSPDELGAIQWKRFQRLLSFAYTHIPFYRDRFKEAGLTPQSIRNREDLLRIPILTKEDVRRNFPDRLVDSRRRLKPSQIGRTSGSTSDSLHFARPEKSWRYSLFYSVHLHRGLSNLPALIHTTPHCTANTCSLHEEENARATKTTKMDRIRWLRHLNGEIGLPSNADILAASDEYMKLLAEIIALYSPCVMIVDPVYFGAFARYLLRTATPAPDVRCIITTYELLTGSLRDLLRRVFRCEVYSQYGASELPDIANECEHRKLHLRSNNVLFETIRDGRPAAPGQIGRAVVTDLRNYNMPLIRYDIGDVVMPTAEPCACGRNNETIEAVHGRAGDLIRPDGTGRLLTPLQVDEMFRGVPGIAAYRLVQRAKNRYHVEILRDALSAAPEAQLLTQRGRSLFGDGSQFRIDFVDAIKPLASKKFRFVYSELSPVSL